MMRILAARHAALVVLALGVALGAASRVEASSAAFDAAMTQVYEQYVLPNGLTLGDLERDIPTHLAIMIGLVLQGQMEYVAGNSALQEPFVQLQQEFRDYLGGVAQRAGNVERFTGKPISRDILWGLSFDAIQGRYDQFAAKEYGRGPSPGPSVFTAQGSGASQPGTVGLEPERVPPVPSRTPPSGDSGKLLHPPDDHINLLGVRADGVERSPDPIPLPQAAEPPPDRKEDE